MKLTGVKKMELGQKLKQARLEMGLSQRELCGEEITRNMLSQIENGSARPSMDTLRYLAARLGKSVSFFLEEDAVTSPNQSAMEQARAAWRDGDFRGVEAALEGYREPDPVFDLERQLLGRLAALAAAEDAEKQGKPLYAVQILEQLGKIEAGYCGLELERRRLLMLGRLRSRDWQAICDELPGLDEELLLRARAALEGGDELRAERLLEAAEDRSHPDWNILRGRIYRTQRQYEAAVECFLRAVSAYPAECAAELERCYRELGNFERAYFYACRRREESGYGKTE